VLTRRHALTSTSALVTKEDVVTLAPTQMEDSNAHVQVVGDLLMEEPVNESLAEAHAA